MTDESRQLVDRAKEGDDGAVEELLRCHLKGLEVFAKNRMGQLLRAKETPSDVVQSACREVLQHLQRFDYDGEEGFRRWLYATALRKIKDHHRRYSAGKRDAAREIPLGGGSSSNPGQRYHELSARLLTTPSGKVVQDEEIERVKRALSELPEDYRRVVELFYLEQLPHRRIAEALEMTESHARVLLSRALARLSARLGGAGKQ